MNTQKGIFMTISGTEPACSCSTLLLRFRTPFHDSRNGDMVLIARFAEFIALGVKCHMTSKGLGTQGFDKFSLCCRMTVLKLLAIPPRLVALSRISVNLFRLFGKGSVIEIDVFHDGNPISRFAGPSIPRRPSAPAAAGNRCKSRISPAGSPRYASPRRTWR
jgi:hypothetical protein